jgi:hypothetical protein
MGVKLELITSDQKSFATKKAITGIEFNAFVKETEGIEDRIVY